MQHVASDTPSMEMFRVFKQVLPQLESIALDAMHIIMVYQQNMSNKKTHGSRWLAVIMDKFRKRDPARTAASWGPFYTGHAGLTGACLSGETKPRHTVAHGDRVLGGMRGPPLAICR